MICLGFNAQAQISISRPLIVVPSTIGASPVTVDQARQRVYLAMLNLDGANTVGCTFDGSTPVVGAAGTMTFLPHQGYVWDSGVIPSNVLICIASGSNTAFTVLE
jgi:hypothetical protein